MGSLSTPIQVIIQPQKSTKFLFEETHSYSSSLSFSPCGRNLGPKPTSPLQQHLFISLQFYFLKDKEYLVTSSIRNFPSTPRKGLFFHAKLNFFPFTPRRPNNESKTKQEFETISNSQLSAHIRGFFLELQLICK